MAKNSHVTTYRIPKHIPTPQRYAGLTMKAWVTVGVTGITGFIALLVMLLYPAPGFSGLFKKILFSVAFVGLPTLVVRDERLLPSFYTAWYHHKHSKIVRWESDSDAFFKKEIYK